jgi:hypothetical protein
MTAMTMIETFQHNGFTVKIDLDDSGTESPRHDSNLGVFWTMERNTNSPDALPCRGNDFQSLADSLNCAATWHSIQKAWDAQAVWLPVWKYEHSGVVYVAADSNPFGCLWDSGQAGVIFALKADVRKEYGVTRVDAKTRAKALQVLQGEVQTYSQWANGEVYGYTITGEAGEEVDSCWGFIGDLDYVRDEAKAACA